MNKAFKIVLMVCVIVLVLTISGSMIYYFAFAKPGNERANLEWEKEKLEKEQAQKKEEERAEHLKELTRQAQLNTCLDNAYENYVKQWDAEVSRVNPGVRKVGEKGLLPINIADVLNENYQNQKEECFKLYGPD